MITTYLAGVAATVALFAVRTPNTEIRPVALIALGWPVMLPVALLIGGLDAFGYDIDVKFGAKMLGFRKPQNPEVKGFAVSFCTAEVQVWKVRTV